MQIPDQARCHHLTSAYHRVEEEQEHTVHTAQYIIQYIIYIIADDLKRDIDCVYTWRLCAEEIWLLKGQN